MFSIDSLILIFLVVIRKVFLFAMFGDKIVNKYY